jgi:hypothetical protein
MISIQPCTCVCRHDNMWMSQMNQITFHQASSLGIINDSVVLWWFREMMVIGDQLMTLDVFFGKRPQSNTSRAMRQVFMTSTPIIPVSWNNDSKIAWLCYSKRSSPTETNWLSWWSPCVNVSTDASKEMEFDRFSPFCLGSVSSSRMFKFDVMTCLFQKIDAIRDELKIRDYL